MKTLISAVLLFFAAVAPASADQKVFAMDGWEGHRMGASDAYTHCAASTYRVMFGTVLSLAITRDGHLVIDATSPNWLFRRDQVLSAQVTVDDRLIANHVETIAYNTVRVIYSEPREIEAATNAIANGKIIAIRTFDARFAFGLKSPRQVLEALAQCNEAAITAEFHVPEAGGMPRQSTAQRADRSEAMVFVANLLARSGVSGQIYLQSSEYRDILEGYDVVWRYPDGTLGAAAIFVDARRSDLDTVSSNVLKGEAAFCKGDFSSGVKKNEESGQAIQKIMFTACDGEQSTRDTNYVLTVTEQGVLLAIGTIGLSEGKQDLVQDTGEAIARGAQLSF